MLQPNSPAMSDTDVNPHNVRLDGDVANGTQRGNVVRDHGGQVLYPGHVPPGPRPPTLDVAPESPASSPTLTPAGAEPRETQETQADAQAAGGGRARGNSEPTARRPTVGRKWETDVPQWQQRSNSIFAPAMRRVGTNASQLQTALWTPPPEHDDSTSSTTSSDDETDAEPPAPTRTTSSRPRQASEADKYRRFWVGNAYYRTKGRVSRKDGRLSISVKDTSSTGYLAKALGQVVKKMVAAGDEGAKAFCGEHRPSITRLPPAVVAKDIKCPKLNIVIMVIGSRGDAQPFLKIGKILKTQYGHRVRIATHPAFKEFVERDSGLEFFSVGGDPAELMAFMVKNPGMIPTLETVRAGDIGRRRAAMAEMFEGFWRACVNATDDDKDVRNMKMIGDKDPFVADAIIANPPSFAHLHCAEALGIPLHLMFTFPYTPTQAFPHPLANIKKTNVDPGYANFISYPLVEMMIWQGLGDLVNEFRTKTLGLDAVSTLWAPGSTYRLHVPFTYLWSPGLVPKAADWGDEIDVAGFVFLDLASTFHPSPGLTEFLDAGEMPIYIGFGSIVVDDAKHFTEMIFEAVKLAGVRALVSKGWGGLGGDNVPDNIYMLGNTPHDWLFPRIRACVIHGGAGTTAIALKCGRPTMVVPFFGDQYFWGSMLKRSKVGPEPIPYKELTAEKLAEGIKYLLTDEAADAAAKIAQEIELEGDGAENACESFHRRLPLQGSNSMRCSFFGDQLAAWKLKRTDIRLSPLAAYLLVEKGYLSWKRLRLIRHCEWNDFEGPGEPVSGITGSVMGTVGEFFKGIASVPHRMAKKSRARARKLKEKEEAKAEAEAARKAAANGQANGQANGTAKPKGGGDAGEDRDYIPLKRATTNGSAAQNPTEEFLADLGAGMHRSAHAIARAPYDLSMALVQGFHNAPRLYGDDTVRRPPRVSGIKSGLLAAGHEFAFGLYDGFTGLVRLPFRGARSGRVGGFVKGVGMGLTGFVLKDIGAVIAPLGYTLKGLKKQVERRRQPYHHVRRARILEGQRALRRLPEPERRRRARQAEHGLQVMRALWDAVERDERRRHRRRRVLRRVKLARKRRALGPACGSVEVAERALAAIRAGEDVDAVVERVRRSEEAAAARGPPPLGIARARSWDAARALERAAAADGDGGGDGDADGGRATRRVTAPNMKLDGRDMGAPPRGTVEAKQRKGRA